LLERGAGLGGQLRLAGGVPAHDDLWIRYRRMAERDLARLGVEVRLGAAARPEDLEGYDRVVLATGARPYRPLLPTLDVMVVDAWSAIAEPELVEGPVLVADWGGEWSGLDAAEALAHAGREVTLASAATVAGETIHQYQRNLYLARLDLLGVRLLPHVELVAGDHDAHLRNVFSGRRLELGPIATL